MIIEKTIRVKVSNRIKSYYNKLGYDTSLSELEVKIEDLQKSSNYKILVGCDICNLTRRLPYNKWVKNTNSGNRIYTCHKCSSIKNKETCLAKFGVDNPSKCPEIREKVVQKFIKKFGADNPQKNSEVREKTKKTNLNRWGVESPSKSEEISLKIKNSIIDKWEEDGENILNKIKNTNLTKYGVEFPLQSSEILKNFRNTNLEKYGVEYHIASEEIREKSILKWGGVSSFCNKEVRDKAKKTMIERWGVEFPSQNEFIKNKIFDTNIQNFGTKSPLSSEKIREKIREILIEKWGVDNISKSEEIKNKRKEVSLSRWGVDNITKSEEFRSSNYYISQNANYIKYLGEGISEFNCDFGKDHKFELSSNLFRYRDQMGYGLCTVCLPIGEKDSLNQNMVQEFISSIYEGEIVKNHRIDSVECDIFLPKLKIGFEFNGLYWHSEKFKDAQYHYEKTKFYEMSGIRIVHIWEDEWIYKKDIVKSIISNCLGKSDRKIWARNCKVQEIKDGSDFDFLEKNHIQGKINSLIKLGLFYNGELVSLMTFGNLRKSLGSEKKNGHFEMLRFCNSLNTNVVGGFSKLFDHFKRNYKFDKIISYCDISKYSGNVYQKSEFKLIGETKPNYYYIKKNKRFHRFGFRKSVLVKSGACEKLTEREIMSQMGHYRIYDCGSKKYIYC